MNRTDHDDHDDHDDRTSRRSDAPLDPRIEQRIDAGDWRGAAQLAHSLGELELAEGLYLKLLDYASAGRLAVERDEPIAALEHYLQGGHTEAAEALRVQMLASLSEEIPLAVELFAERRRYHAAAELAGSVGQLARAAELYQRAHSHLEAAQHYERIGRFREAGEHYEAHLAAAPRSFEARLGLGRILQRFDRHHDACEALQGALGTAAVAGAEDPEQLELRERLAYSLLHLRLRETAAAVLGPARQHELDDLRAFVTRFRETWGVTGSGFSERYRVQGELAGPFAEAYAAHDAMAERAVLVQPLHGSAPARSAYLEAQARLSEPPISGALELVDADREGLRYAVFEHPAGPTLAALLLESAPTGPQIGTLLRQLAGVLEQAHRRGVLHAALSPWSLFVRPGFGLVVAGFELAQLGSRAETATAGGADHPLSYLAPEVAFGQEADFRSDFWGLGAILWRVATGAPPLARRPGEGPAGWEALFDALLAPRAEARPQSHGELGRWLASADWARLPVASPAASASGEASSGESGAGRYELVEQLGQGVVRVRDRWLEREVVRVEFGRALEVSELDRVRVLSHPSLAALQRILQVDAEAGRVDLAAPGRAHVALEGEGLACVARELTLVQRLRALVRVASTLARLHALGQPLGGFEVSSLRLDLRDGAATLPIAASQLLEVGAGGAAYAADATSLSRLEAVLVEDVSLRARLGTAAESLREREEAARRLLDEVELEARRQRVVSRLASQAAEARTPAAAAALALLEGATPRPR